MLLLVVTCVAALLAAHRAFAKARQLPVDIQLHIQDMVRERVAAHWPFVRAHEHRTRPAASLVAVGEWIVFTSSFVYRHFAVVDGALDLLLVGKVVQVGTRRVPNGEGVAPVLKVAVYDRVPGTDHFVRWSPAAHSTEDVQPRAGSWVLHGG